MQAIIDVFRRIERELADLQGTLKLLREEGIYFDVCRQSVEAKSEKLKKYMTYAEKKGTFQLEDK